VSSSVGKRQREQAKKDKADAKRQRQQRAADPPLGEASVDEGGDNESRSESPGDLLDMIAELHRQFEAGSVSFEDFEAKKKDLLARLVID
jgi:hypothetical protein